MYGHMYGFNNNMIRLLVFFKDRTFFSIFCSEPPVQIKVTSELFVKGENQR